MLSTGSQTSQVTFIVFFMTELLVRTFNLPAKDKNEVCMYKGVQRTARVLDSWFPHCGAV